MEERRKIVDLHSSITKSFSYWNFDTSFVSLKINMQLFIEYYSVILPL